MQKIRDLRKLYKEYASGMIKDTLDTYSIPYMIILASISAFEVYMIVRAFLVFDFDNITHLVYFISYQVLLISSLITFALLEKNRKTHDIYDILGMALNTYALLIILWSVVITGIDVYRGNTMIVYLTIVVFVSVIIPVHPVLYTMLVIPTSVGLILFAQRYGSGFIASGGYDINVVVFIFFSIVLSFVQYFIKIIAFSSKYKLEQMSFRDQLTGALNRRSMNQYIKNLSDQSVSIGMADVDNFKSINDQYGHDIGDDCLIRIAQLLEKYYGKNVYRYGGDEFAIITRATTREIQDSFYHINSLLKEVYGNKNIHISAGFYSPRQSTGPFTSYFKNADNALYEAKHEGKNKIIIIDEFNNKML